MDRSRWTALMDNLNLKLTQAEMLEGWHWCWDYDGLLVGPGMIELETCVCDIPSVKRAKERQGVLPREPMTPEDVEGLLG